MLKLRDFLIIVTCILVSVLGITILYVEAAGLFGVNSRNQREEKLVKRSENMANTYEAQQNRAQDLQDGDMTQQKRYDKILDTWEKQQAQYQKYLDGLDKGSDKKEAR